ncbi:MAG: DUF2063 domain-containing protein [Gammaproteobacteria bacterium]
MAEPAADAALRDRQYALARHLRDPAAHPAPAGLEDRRLQVYRDLFYNSLESLLAGNFPVIRRILGDDAWHALVRAFYAGHRCRTPLFTELGREFVDFLQARAPQAVDPPWLAELAHYEWAELALQISPAQAPAAAAGSGDAPDERALLDWRPRISPLAWALAYRWPVHRIAPAYRPQTPPAAPTLLLLRRDRAGRVHFSELSAPAWRLLDLIEGQPRCSAGDALGALAAEAGVVDRAARDAFLAQGVAMLRRLRAEGVLVDAAAPEDTVPEGAAPEDGPAHDAGAAGAAGAASD